MRRNKRIQYAILGTLLILILASRLTGRDSTPEPVRPWEGTVTRMRIQGPGETVTAWFEDGTWTLGENRRAADQGKLTAMADAVNMLRIEQMVSRGNDFERFGLDDENAITVEAFAGDDLLRSIRIGKEAEKGSGAYITVGGRSGIYLAGGSLRSRFDTGSDELRNRQILALSSAGILAVKISAPGGPFSLWKDAGDDEQWHLPETGDKALDREKVKQYVAQLSGISAVGFKGENDGSAPPAGWHFSIQDQSGNYELSIHGQDPDNGNAFVCSSPESPDYFTISAYKAEQLMKEAEWFAAEGDG